MGPWKEVVAVAALVLTSFTASACSASEGDSGGSCAFRVEFDGRMYEDVANISITMLESLGDGVSPSCDDHGEGPGPGIPAAPSESVEAYRIEVFRVEGLDPQLGLGVRIGPGGSRLVVNSDSDPKAVEEFLQGHAK